MTLETARDIVRGLSNLYPLQAVEEEAILTLLRNEDHGNIRTIIEFPPFIGDGKIKQ